MCGCPSLGVSSSFVIFSVCADVAADQVEEREEEDPDDVDEVPVQSADLNRAHVVAIDGPVSHPRQHPRHDAKADNHVERVKAGQDEVERKEELRLLCVLGLELKR